MTFVSALFKNRSLPVVLAMSVEKVNKPIQSVLITLSNIEQLKSEREEYIRPFIAGKDVVALLPTGLFTVLTF